MSTPDDPRDEYDFGGGSRGGHYRRLRKDGAVVRLDPDVAERFPTSESVNTALRALAREGSDAED